MNQQSPEHQLINRLNNVCVKFNLYIYIIIITLFQIYTLHKMQHLVLVLYKEYPKHVHYYVLKIIVHVSFDCSIRVYQSICTLCGENIFQHEYYSSNKDQQNIVKAPPSQLHLYSYIMIWPQFLMINNLC